MDIRAEYLKWLKSIVANKSIDKYCKLFAFLLDYPFYWSVPLDENRAINGVELRERFLKLNDALYLLDELNSLVGEDCSVLEMLVALSARASREINTTDGSEEKAPYWFWTMIDNMGLDKYMDSYFESNVVDYLVSRTLNRDYEFDGNGGGLFVVDYPIKDMRKVQIWMQLSWFVAQEERGL